MRLVVCALLIAGTLGLCLAAPKKTIRWCVVSDLEAAKCSGFRDNMREVLPEDGPSVTCVMKTSSLECIQDILANKIDAVTIDGALMAEAGLTHYNLKPVMAEYYGSKDDPQTHFLCRGRGKEGNRLPTEPAPGQEVLPRRPGLVCWVVRSPQRTAPSWLIANRCLEDGKGDVSFLRHLTLFEVLPQKADRDQYELLCPDNTRRPVEEYEQCYLARVPSHVVVARSVDGKGDLIQELLGVAQEHFGKDKSSTFQLFGSPLGKDLLFTDAARGFLRVPPKMDIKLYLGYELSSDIQNLQRGLADSQRVKWCAVGQQERAKCDQWSAVSGGALACVTEETPEDCMAAVTKGEADAVSLDGGFAYIAGHCGLVPVLGENYLSTTHGSGRLGSKCVNAPLEGYYVVAVVKKSDVGITWNSLRGKKSCHTAVGTSAGWNVPMGLIYNQTGSCNFDAFFSRSCAPGSNPDSRLCALCAGGNSPAHMCAANSHEGYHGSSGALRCLVEKGDVAFVKHPTVLQNTDGKNQEAWAKGLRHKDFELLCLDGARKPVTEAQSCHLARVPNHTVFSRKDKADFVRRILFNQQELFGRNGFEYMMFQMFESSPKDLLFSDDTECLSNLQNKTTYKTYLGPQYLTWMDNFRQCLSSELLDACTFHRH